MDPRLVVATSNAHKVGEFRRILAPCGFRVVSPAEAGVFWEEIPENAPDFEGNARLKVWSMQPDAGDWVLADDSGLVVPLLGGAPGVRSARLAQDAGRGKGDADNRAELARRLRARGIDHDRSVPASFVCALVLRDPMGQVRTARGFCEGRVGPMERGTGGFGYDPMFVPLLAGGRLAEGTFAQLPWRLKDALSHRGRALRRLRSMIT